MSVKRETIIEWLDEQGWPQDPRAQTPEQNQAMRQALGICGAVNRNDEPCGNEPKSNGRCRFHMGNAPRGIGHYNFKHGKYSLYVPPPLEEAYQQAMNDPDLLSLNKAIAMNWARLEQLNRRVDTREAGTMWKAAQQEFGRLQELLRNEDTEENRRRVREQIMIVATALGRGRDDAETWDEIKDTTEHLRGLIATETQHRVKMREVVSAEDALWHYRQLSISNREVIEEADFLEEEEKRTLRLLIAQRFAEKTGIRLDLSQAQARMVEAA